MRAARVLAVLTFLPRIVVAQGNPVGPEFRVNTFTPGFQFASSVAADPSGSVVVVWNSQQDGSDEGVFGQRYAGSGIPIGPEFRVNTYTTGFQEFPSVAADLAGNFVVVWHSGQDGSALGIFGQRYASSGAPLGPEFRVNTYTTSSQFFPSVASDAGGNFVVVWNSPADESGTGVFGQRFASSGAPMGPEFRVNTVTFAEQYVGNVASDAAGSFVVVWDSLFQDGSQIGVFGQRFASSGTPIGPEFRVNTFTIDNQLGPRVASDTTGNFVVVWTSSPLQIAGQDGSGAGVFGQRFDTSGVPLGAEFRVNTFTTSNQYSPSIAADSAGNFVVSWQSYSQEGPYGGLAGVFGQRYASSGAPLGPEFRVNTYTTTRQYRSAVAADPLGNFVVTWTSYPGQDGSFHGVFGQRFNMIVPVDLMGFGVE